MQIIYSNSLILLNKIDSTTLSQNKNTHLKATSSLLLGYANNQCSSFKNTSYTNQIRNFKQLKQLKDNNLISTNLNKDMLNQQQQPQPCKTQNLILNNNTSKKTNFFYFALIEYILLKKKYLINLDLKCVNSQKFQTDVNIKNSNTTNNNNETLASKLIANTQQQKLTQIIEKNDNSSNNSDLENCMVSNNK